MTKKTAAFSLLELMIVVAIIGIIATIAMSNFLDASVRARVARTLAEMRTMEGAIAAYHSDHGQVPRMASFRFYGDPGLDTIASTPVNGIMSSVLSTPVAYLGNARIVDPFMEKAKAAPLDEQFYTYQVTSVYEKFNAKSSFWPAARAYYGEWRIGSVGPDMIFDHGFKNSAQLPYDPTNGTVSLGNIWFSKNNSGSLPSIPTLLGEH